jgi:phosphate starvation-inducible PhoH-like protein
MRLRVITWLTFAKSLIIATGEAGCGKTFLATAYAADRLLAKDVQRIIVTRPVLQAEEDLGFLPGDVVRSLPHTSDPSMTFSRSVWARPSSNTVSSQKPK